ncbi:MAG: class I SAM-dependent methyltransferase [Candidatus Bathyarchaeia archaeon]
MASIKDTWLNWYKDRRVEENVALFVKWLLEARVRRVLDFGTGTGRHAVYLARMGFEVYGFDWSDAAITIAKQELSKEKLSASLTVWDMNDAPLPYDDDFFDAVIAVKVLHHTYLEKITRIASEIARITHTGGYVYIESPTYEEAMRQKLEGVRFDEPEPGTFIPLNGEEIGIPHHHFRLDEILKTFIDFRPISFEERNELYCLTGIKK